MCRLLVDLHTVFDEFITALTHLVYGYRNHGLRDRIMGGSDYKTDVHEDQDGIRIFTIWDHF